MSRHNGKNEVSISYLKKANKPLELFERGKDKKRAVINKAKDDESLTEIKEFLYDKDTYTDNIIAANHHNIYDDV